MFRTPVTETIACELNSDYHSGWSDNCQSLWTWTGGRNFWNIHCYLKGKRVSMNPVDTPDYNGCGTEIWVQDAQTNNAHIITCRGGTQIPNLSPGSHLIITHKKLNPPYDSNYCYRFEVGELGCYDLYWSNQSIVSLTIRHFRLVNVFPRIFF